MKKFLKTFSVVISVILTITACCWLFDRRQRQTEQELRQQLNQLKLEFAPAERDTIRDSVSLVTQQVLQMQEREYKLRAADRELLRDLDLRLSQVTAEQRTGTVAADTVKASRHSSLYTYSDPWLTFRLDTADSILTYRARDSLQTIVYRQYRHKFLWWRWGTKGYDVKVVNFNPHSHISYNSYIQVNQ